MGLIIAALRRPITVLVGMVAIAMGSWLAVQRMSVDIFPALNLPVIYVCQPYGGMDPAQMEGLITNYYEYHFLYIAGIHHVESKNVQGVSIMKLVFHPGTDMSQAMGETIAYVNRSRAFMPPGTVPPFVMRFDTGSVPVGCLVLSSETRTIGEIQDLSLFRIRPMFASLPGVSAPPPFGGSQRTVVIRVDPDRLRAYQVSPEDVLKALASGNTISPSGNIQMGDQYPMVPTNALVKQIDELGNVAVRSEHGRVVYMRDLGKTEDTHDLTTGYALFNGRRAIYILANKRAEASTLSVVKAIKAALPDMQKALPDDIKVSFEFDQSPIVVDSIRGLLTEGVLGAILTGLMVLIFLRDWRSAIVVVVNIPLAIAAAVIGLWLTGHTINVMTLSGLALAVGILVDEATVEIENIHTQMARTGSIAVAVRRGNQQTAIPRLLAMLCILAVFAPSVFMQGAAKGMFVPLSLAVGFAMIASYILSSTLVPVLSVLLLRHRHGDSSPAAPSSRAAQPTPTQRGEFKLEARAAVVRRGFFHATYVRTLSLLVTLRYLVVPGYLAACVAVWLLVGRGLGTDIFPPVGSGEFRLRLRAPDGTHFDRTEQIALEALRMVAAEVGENKIDKTLGYVGMVPSSYPINAVYQWSRGPEEAILRFKLKQNSGVDVVALQEKMRGQFATKMPTVRVSFEPADIINEVMSLGSPTPVEVAVIGSSLADNRGYAEKVAAEFSKIDGLRDVQFKQSLDYPTLEVRVDREKAGLSGVTVEEIARSMVTATSSSRFVLPNYWPDPKTGIGYQVQIEIPRTAITSAAQLAAIPVKRNVSDQLLLRDVAVVEPGKMPGQFDRYNMKREIDVAANIAGRDLGSISREIYLALKRAGDPPKGVTIAIRGQVPPLNELTSGLTAGLVLTVVAIFLLLAANFQSLRLPLVAVSTTPAVLVGVAVMLRLTGTTLNIHSFIGAIMALGVAMANAILLLTFAEESRRSGLEAHEAAVSGGESRLRPILMTSFAMTAGMLPMALALGEGGEQAAPLGRAVIGGLVAATIATLFLLPAVFAIVQRNASIRSASLDPSDRDSLNYDPSFEKEGG
ncbi:MAG: efflux RND transporter permease subunit [Planctomycetales bacterium]|nr:efflux RND transporter permease subunit [Planctomycetales bacterium]